MLFKARAGSLETNNRTYRFEEGNPRRCLLCNLEEGERETLFHMMVECPAYDEEMGWAKTMYINEVGMSKFNELFELDDRGLGFFLGFEKEASSRVVEITKMYLGKIWYKRSELYRIGGKSISYGIDNQGF